MDKDETVAQTVGFMLTVGAMTIIFICALIMQEWVIAAIAIFFACLLWVLSYEQIKEYFHGTEDSASTVHQTRQHQNR